MIKQSEKSKLIKEFAKNEQDTGSTAVQIAILSNHIAELQQHTVKHSKDFSSKRGLMQMVNARKKLLIYLQKTSVSEYKDVIKRLGIRK
jgi:small subunit ribosomal protein S15